MHPSATSTWRALRPSGGRNAPTASDTASMPVSDAPPLANARNRVRIIAYVISPLAPLPMCTVPCSACGSYFGRLRASSRLIPITIIRITDPANT